MRVDLAVTVIISHPPLAIGIQMRALFRNLKGLERLNYVVDSVGVPCSANMRRVADLFPPQLLR